MLVFFSPDLRVSETGECYTLAAGSTQDTPTKTLVDRLQDDELSLPLPLSLPHLNADNLPVLPLVSPLPHFALRTGSSLCLTGSVSYIPHLLGWRQNKRRARAVLPLLFRYLPSFRSRRPSPTRLKYGLQISGLCLRTPRSGSEMSAGRSEGKERTMRTRTRMITQWASTSR